MIFFDFHLFFFFFFLHFPDTFPSKTELVRGKTYNVVSDAAGLKEMYIVDRPLKNKHTIFTIQLSWKFADSTHCVREK